MSFCTQGLSVGNAHEIDSSKPKSDVAHSSGCPQNKTQPLIVFCLSPLAVTNGQRPGCQALIAYYKAPLFLPNSKSFHLVLWERWVCIYIAC